MRSAFFILVFSFPAFAQHRPLWNKGEIKINYPCEVANKLPKEKEEKEVITFYDKDKNPYFISGFIFRKRVGEKTDFTVKYRTQSQSMILDDKLFDELSHSLQGELECEFDMTYNHLEPTTVYSCGFKSKSSSPLSLHQDFVKMTGVSVPEWSLNLKGMKTFSVESTSWKYKLSAAQKKANPFSKAPSIEKWETRGDCRLEISGKLAVTNSGPSSLHKEAEKAFTFLKSLVPGSPSGKQGNKTGWALGVE